MKNHKQYLLAEVMKHAYKNYEDGWDILVECHTEKEILEAIGKATKVTAAITNVSRKFSIHLHHNHRLEIEATAF